MAFFFLAVRNKNILTARCKYTDRGLLLLREPINTREIRHHWISDLFFGVCCMCVAPLDQRTESGKGRRLPECESRPVATVHEVVLLLGHHNLLALHRGNLGCVGGDSRWWRRDRGRSSRLTEAGTRVVHRTLHLVHWRLIHLWWLCLLRSGNLILIHGRVYGLSLEGRDGSLLRGGVWRRRGKMMRSKLHRGCLRCGRIHAPAVGVERLLVYHPRRVWRIPGWRHAGYHGVVRWG